MSKRKFKETEDYLENENEREDIRRLKRSNTEPVNSNSQSKADRQVTVPDFNKIQTMNLTKSSELLIDEESNKEIEGDTSPDESKESGSEDVYESDNETEAESQPKKSLASCQNYLFYKNKRKSTPQGDYIENILKFWKEDYNKLEIHHGYIQWLFPNFYGSAFNRDAFKLEKEEAKIFREDKEVAERLQRAYKMILGFYGMVLADPKTGKLERSKQYESRYHKTLITSLHNHLRIRRILAHLNIVGFRKYAIELVKFLETEIFGGVGEYKKYIENKKNHTSDYLKNLKKNPLYQIIRYDVYKDWKIYGETETKDEEQTLHQNCFTSDPADYEDSVLLRDDSSEKVESK